MPQYLLECTHTVATLVKRPTCLALSAICTCSIMCLSCNEAKHMQPCLFVKLPGYTQASLPLACLQQILTHMQLSFCGLTLTAGCGFGGAAGFEQCACGERSGVCGLLSGGPGHKSMALPAPRFRGARPAAGKLHSVSLDFSILTINNSAGGSAMSTHTGC